MDCTKCVLQFKDSPPFPASACTIGCVKPVAKCVRCIGGPRSPPFDGKACVLGCAEQASSVWPSVLALGITLTLIAALTWYLLRNHSGVQRMSRWSRFRSRSRSVFRTAAATGTAGTAAAHDSASVPAPPHQERSGHRRQPPAHPPRELLLPASTTMVLPQVPAHPAVTHGLQPLPDPTTTLPGWWTTWTCFPLLLIIVAMTLANLPRRPSPPRIHSNNGPTSAIWVAPTVLVALTPVEATPTAGPRHPPWLNNCLACWGGPRGSPFPAGKCLLGCSVPANPTQSCQRCALDVHTGDATIPVSRCLFGCTDLAAKPVQCLQCTLGPLSPTPFPAGNCLLGCKQAYAPPATSALTGLPALLLSLTLATATLICAYAILCKLLAASRRAVGLIPLRLTAGPITMVDLDDPEPQPERRASLMPGRFPVTPTRDLSPAPPTTTSNRLGARFRRPKAASFAARPAEKLVVPPRDEAPALPHTAASLAHAASKVGAALRGTSSGPRPEWGDITPSRGRSPRRFVQKLPGFKFPITKRPVTSPSTVRHRSLSATAATRSEFPRPASPTVPLITLPQASSDKAHLEALGLTGVNGPMSGLAPPPTPPHPDIEATDPATDTPKRPRAPTPPPALAEPPGQHPHTNQTEDNLVVQHPPPDRRPLPSEMDQAPPSLDPSPPRATQSTPRLEVPAVQLPPGTPAPKPKVQASSPTRLDPKAAPYTPPPPRPSSEVSPGPKGDDKAGPAGRSGLSGPKLALTRPSPEVQQLQFSPLTPGAAIKDHLANTLARGELAADILSEATDTTPPSPEAYPPGTRARPHLYHECVAAVPLLPSHLLAANECWRTMPAVIESIQLNMLEPFIGPACATCLTRLCGPRDLWGELEEVNPPIPEFPVPFYHFTPHAAVNHKCTALPPQALVGSAPQPTTGQGTLPRPAGCPTRPGSNQDLDLIDWPGMANPPPHMTLMHYQPSLREGPSAYFDHLQDALMLPCPHHPLEGLLRDTPNARVRRNRLIRSVLGNDALTRSRLALDPENARALHHLATCLREPPPAEREPTTPRPSDAPPGPTHWGRPLPLAPAPGSPVTTEFLSTGATTPTGTEFDLGPLATALGDITTISGAQPHIYASCSQQFRALDVEFLLNTECWRSLPGLLAHIHANQLRVPRGAVCGRCLNLAVQSGNVAGSTRLVGTLHHGSSTIQLWHARYDGARPSPVPEHSLVGISLLEALRGVAGPDQVENRDANTIQQYNEVMQHVRLINPFPLPPEQLSLLQRYGIQDNPEPAKGHPHPGNKALENCILYQDVPAALLSLAKPYTLISVSPVKARRIQTICPGLRHTMNPGVVGKDLLRYGPTARQSTCTKVHTPVAFMHDVLHHLGPLDLITMFEHSPNLQVLLASAVIPVEAVYGAKSLWPGLYTLNYDHRSPGLVTYIPAGSNDEPNHGDSYTQPAAAAQWFMHNALSTIGLNIQMNVITHRCAHVLFQFTRGSSFVPINRLVIPTPAMSLLPNLTTQSVPWPERIVPTQLYRDLVVWLQTINLDELSGFDAKYSAILAKATGLSDRSTKKHGAEVERAALFLAKVYPFLKRDIGTTELDRLHNVSIKTWVMRLFSETPWLLNLMDIATPTRLRVREAILAPPAFILSIDPSPYYVTDIDRATTWITAQLAPASLRDLGLLMEGIVLDQPTPPRLDPNSRAADPVDPTPGHVGWSTGDARPEDTILLSQERLGFYEQETLLANFANLGCPRVAGRIVLHEISLPWVTGAEATKLVKHLTYALIGLVLLSSAVHLSMGPNPAGGVVGWIGRLLFSALPIGPAVSTFFPELTTSPGPPAQLEVTTLGAFAITLPYVLSAVLLGGPAVTATVGLSASGLACALDLHPAFCHPLHMLQLAQAELAPSPSWAGASSPHYRPGLVPSADPADALIHRLLGTLQAWAISPDGPTAGAGLLAENLLHLYVYISILGVLWYLVRPLVVLEAAHFVTWVILGSPLGLLTMVPLYLLRRITPSYAFCSRVTQALFPLVYLLQHTDVGRLAWRAISLKGRQVLGRHIEPQLVRLAQWLLSGAPVALWAPRLVRRGTWDLPGGHTLPLYRLTFVFLTRPHLLPPHGQQVVQRIIMQLNPSLSRFPHNPIDWLEYNQIYLRTPARKADDPRTKVKTLTSAQPQVGTWDPLNAALRTLPNLRSRSQWWADQLEDPYRNSHLAGLLPDARLTELSRGSWFARPEPALRKLWPLFTSNLVRTWASATRLALETQASTRHLHVLLISEGDHTLASTLLAFGVTVHYQVISRHAPEYPHHPLLRPYHSHPGCPMDIPPCTGWGLIVLDLPSTSPPEVAKHWRAALARATAETVVVNLHHTLEDPCMSVLAELDQLNRINPIGRRQGFRQPQGGDMLDGAILPTVEFGRPPWLPPNHRDLAAIVRRCDFDPASWHLNPPSDLHYGQVSHITTQVDQILAHLEDRWIRVGLPDPEDAEAEISNFFAKDPAPHDLGTYTGLRANTPVYGSGLARFTEVGHPCPTHLWLNVLAPPALGHPIATSQLPFAQQTNPAHLDQVPIWAAHQPWQPNNPVAADSGPYHDINHSPGKADPLVAIAHYYMTRADEYELPHAALHACRRPADPLELMTFARRHLLLYVDTPAFPLEVMAGTGLADETPRAVSSRLGCYPNWEAAARGRPLLTQIPPILVPAPPRGPDTCALDTLEDVLDIPRDVLWAVIRRHRHAPAVANHDISAAEWTAVLKSLGVQCYMHLAEGVEWTGDNPVGADGPVFMHALVTHSTDAVGPQPGPALLHVTPMTPGRQTRTQRERFRECRCCISSQPLAPEPEGDPNAWPTFQPDPQAAQLLAKEIEEGTIGVLDYTDHQPLRRLRADKPVNIIRSRNRAAGPAIPAQLLLGVPGSAKTTRVIRMLTQLHPHARRGDFIAVLPTRNLRDQVHRRYCEEAGLSRQRSRDARCYFVTFETALVRTVSATTVYIDELGLYPHGYLDLLLLLANPPKRLIMTGDPSQRRWSPQPARRAGMSPHFLSLEPTLERALDTATLYIGESFRLAEGVATSLGIIPRTGVPGQILYTTLARNHLPTIVAESDIRRALVDFGNRAVYTANNCQGVDISGDYQVQLSSSFAKFTADTWFTLLSRGKRNVYLLAPHYRLPHSNGDGAPWLQRLQKAVPSRAGTPISFTTLAASLIETRVPAHLRLALPPNAAPPVANLRGLAHRLATDTARGYTAPNALAHRRVNQHEGVAGAAGPVHTRVPPRRWLDPPDVDTDSEHAWEDLELLEERSDDEEPDEDPQPPAPRDWADHSSLATLPPNPPSPLAEEAGPPQDQDPPQPLDAPHPVGGVYTLAEGRDLPHPRLGFLPRIIRPRPSLPNGPPTGPVEDRPWPRSDPGLFNRPLNSVLPSKIQPLPLTSIQDEYVSAPHEDPLRAHETPSCRPLLGLHPEAIAPSNPVLTQHEMIGEQVDPILRERWDADMRAYSEQFGIDAIPSEATAFAHHKARDRVTARITYKRRLNFRPGYKASTAAHRRAGMLLFTSLVQATKVPALSFDRARWERAQRENVYTQLNKPQSVMRDRDERFVPEWPLNRSKISVKGQWVKKLPKMNGPAHPGQTIACFRGDYVLRFGVMGRYISSVLEDYMRPEIMIFTRMNLEQFNARLRARWNFGSLCEEDDFSAYDESQTAETLEAECMFMRHIGIPEEYIREYDHLKRCTECQLHAKELDVARFSGEWGTYILNCLINIAYTNLKYHIPESATQLYSGDDQVCDTTRTQRPSWDSISHLFLLQGKPHRTTTPTFCSMAITPAGLIRNPKDLAYRALHGARRGTLFKTGPSLALDLGTILMALPRYAMTLPDPYLQDLATAIQILFRHAADDPLTAQMLDGTLPGSSSQPTPYGSLPAPVASLVNAHVALTLDRRAPTMPRREWAHAPPNIPVMLKWSTPSGPRVPNQATQTPGVLLIRPLSPSHGVGVPTLTITARPAPTAPPHVAVRAGTQPGSDRRPLASTPPRFTSPMAPTANASAPVPGILTQDGRDGPPRHPGTNPTGAPPASPEHQALMLCDWLTPPAPSSRTLFLVHHPRAQRATHPRCIWLTTAQLDAVVTQLPAT